MAYIGKNFKRRRGGFVIKLVQVEAFTISVWGRIVNQVKHSRNLSIYSRIANLLVDRRLIRTLRISSWIEQEISNQKEVDRKRCLVERRIRQRNVRLNLVDDYSCVVGKTLVHYALYIALYRLIFRHGVAIYNVTWSLGGKGKNIYCYLEPREQGNL